MVKVILVCEWTWWNSNKVHTQSFQDRILFFRLIIRHDYDTFVSALGSDNSQTDSGISGSPFNDSPAWFQDSGAFSGLDNSQGRAVFYTSADLVKFSLAVYMAT
jgi:hypothetical protein